MFGYVAAAYTTLFCYAVFAVSHYFYMRYGVKKSLGITRIFRTPRMMLLFLIIIVAGLTIVGLYNLPYIRYPLLGAAFIVLIIKHKTVLGIIKSVRKPKKAEI